jgi:CMP-N-acetylneuraminic acid synthetase
MKILIPARGGSKRIKDKNLQKINGRTLLEITIDHAKQLGEVYVSSDDDRILALAEANDCRTLIRDPEDCLDTSPTLPIWKKFQALVGGDTAIMQCTTPHRPIAKLKIQMKEFLGGHWISGFSGQLHTPFVHVLENKMVYKCFEGNRPRSQDFDKQFIIEDGGLYVCKGDHVQSLSDLWEGSEPYLFRSDIALDIDNIDDLEIARGLL